MRRLARTESYHQAGERMTRREGRSSDRLRIGDAGSTPPAQYMATADPRTPRSYSPGLISWACFTSRLANWREMPSSRATSPMDFPSAR